MTKHWSETESYSWNAELFSQLIKQSRCTIEDLSDKIGMSVTSIIKCQQGKTCPALTTLIKISDFFQVPIDILMGRYTEEEYSEILKGNAEYMLKCRKVAYEQYLLKRNSNFVYAFPTESIALNKYAAVYPYNLVDHIFGEPVMVVLNEDQLEGLNKALSMLTIREQQCLHLYFDEEKTLDEIGKIYGVRRERSRQIISKALRKLRHPSKLAMIKYGIKGQEIANLESIEKDIDARRARIDEKVKELNESLAELEEKQHYIEDISGKTCSLKSNEIDELFAELDLSVRSYNALKRAGCTSVNDILNLFKDGSIMKVRNLGRKSIEEIMNKLSAKYHIKFTERLNSNNRVEGWDYEDSFEQIAV